MELGMMSVFFNLKPKLPSLMPDLKDFMTTDEAADVLGFHIVTIRQMVQRGKLQSIKAGTALLISRRSLEQYKRDTAGMSKNDPRRGKKKEARVAS